MPVRKRTAYAAILFLAGGVPAVTAAQNASLPTYESIQGNGITLPYRDIGKGKPLVLLHGFMDTGAEWDPFLKDLTSKYRVIVPDLRGHGRSINPSGQFTTRELALDVFALLDRLGIDHFEAMGISMGAMTLLHLATMSPARVDAMVLIGGTPYLPETARTIYRSVDPDAIPRERLESMAGPHSGGVPQVLQLMRQFRSYKDSYDDMSFTPPQLATIRASTLIVHGDRDEFFPVPLAVEMYQAIPHSYLWIVPNGEHTAPITTARGREAFIEVALDFLSGIWQSR
jgi:pimeloyl-ACP methyl ester carboxylesterase